MGRGLDGYFLPLVLCGFQAPPGVSSRKSPVAHSEWETPLPIPNRAVKPLCADGTWGATPWESRSPPVLFAVRAREWRGLRRPMSGALRRRQAARVALLRHAACRRRPACSSNASLSRPSRARTAEISKFTRPARISDGLEAVLAEGGEVDR